MMSEQHQFGKMSPPPASDEFDAEYASPAAEPVLRHAFADEYEGFEQGEAEAGGYAAEEVPPPVEGLWDETVRLPEVEIHSYAPPPPEAPAEDLWGGASAPQPYHPPAPEEPLPPEEYVEEYVAQPIPYAEVETEAYPPQEYVVEQPVQETGWQEPPIATAFEPAYQEQGAALAAQEWQEPVVEGYVPIAEDAPSFGPKLSIPIAEPEPDAAAQEEIIPEAAAPLSLQEELLAVVAQHQQWLESGGKEGRRATFRGDHFRGADFSGLMLSEASFRGAVLPATKFRGSNLDRADFVESEMSSADFTHASLSGATFQRAQLSQADFSMVTAPETDFSSVEAVGATFQRAGLEWSVFRDAQLGEADFRQANVAKSNLRGASLFRARMEDVNLTQADCREVNFDHAQMDRALLLQANFRSANLQGVSMQTTDFSQAVDVPMEAQVDSAQKEREWLQQEAQRMEILKAELLAKERELNLEREKLRHSPAGSRAAVEPPVMQGRRLNGLMQSSEMSVMLKRHSKLFVKLGAGWLVLVLAVVGILLNVIAEMDSGQLNFLELVILGILLIAPLAMSLIGVVKSMNLSSRLLDFSAEHDS